nr:uridine phosphorylase 1-like [Danaus plexippus plexippus]
MDCDCDFLLPPRDSWEGHYGNCSSIWCKEHDEPAKNKDGTIRLRNKHLVALEYDVLYHLGLDTKSNDLQTMFGDVKFVCMGGTKKRMKDFAEYIANVLQLPNEGLVNITKNSHRYAMYKIGPVLSVNHGMGVPSMTILLQEIIKMLFYAKAKDPIFFRIGTCGGLKIPAGSVVISSWALNGTMEKSYNLPIMGEVHKLPSFFDKRLNQELHFLASEETGFETFIAGTMAADDFYQGQARLDGPFCDYSEADKMSFLNQLFDIGVRNIEMEATAFAALTSQAGIRAADVCVTFLDRLKGDQVTSSKSKLVELQERPMVLVGKYISRYYVTKLK